MSFFHGFADELVKLSSWDDPTIREGAATGVLVGAPLGAIFGPKGERLRNALYTARDAALAGATLAAVNRLLNRKKKLKNDR